MFLRLIYFVHKGEKIYANIVSEIAINGAATKTGEGRSLFLQESVLKDWLRQVTDDPT